jgi:hypothetical protein
MLTVFSRLVSPLVGRAKGGRPVLRVSGLELEVPGSKAGPTKGVLELWKSQMKRRGA